jgi:hypothetical protein
VSAADSVVRTHGRSTADSGHCRSRPDGRSRTWPQAAADTAGAPGHGSAAADAAAVRAVAAAVAAEVSATRSGVIGWRRRRNSTRTLDGFWNAADPERLRDEPPRPQQGSARGPAVCGCGQTANRGHGRPIRREKHVRQVADEAAGAVAAAQGVTVLVAVALLSQHISTGPIRCVQLPAGRADRELA